MHDCDDPKVVGLVDVDDGVGKIHRQMSPGRRVEGAVSPGILTDFGDETVNLLVEAIRETESLFIVVVQCVGKLDIRIPMKTVGLHRPMIFRAFAMTSS